MLRFNLFEISLTGRAFLNRRERGMNLEQLDENCELSQCAGLPTKTYSLLREIWEKIFHQHHRERTNCYN